MVDCQEFRKIDWVIFSEKICSTELRLYTGFLRLLVASEVSEVKLLLVEVKLLLVEVFVFVSFEDKSGYIILDLLEFVKKMFRGT